MDRSSARLRAGDRDTICIEDEGGDGLRVLGVVLLDETAGSKLDEVQGEKCEDVPNPHDAVRQNQIRDMSPVRNRGGTHPMYPPETPATRVNGQFPYAAMIEEMSCAIPKAAMSAVEGRSTKNHEWDRVMKISA